MANMLDHKAPKGIELHWKRYASQFTREEADEIEVVHLIRYVIETYRSGYNLNADDVEQLVEEAGIHVNFEDFIANEVEAIVGTLRVLTDEYEIKGLRDDRN